MSAECQAYKGEGEVIELSVTSRLKSCPGHGLRHRVCCATVQFKIKTSFTFYRDSRAMSNTANVTCACVLFTFLVLHFSCSHVIATGNLSDKLRSLIHFCLKMSGISANKNTGKLRRKGKKFISELERVLGRDSWANYIIRPLYPPTADSATVPRDFLTYNTTFCIRR